MSKKINKNITDSEELFKRLETGNTEGLDDFEKEAFEGFSSLNDVKLSEKLNSELESKINEVYFKAAAKKNSIGFLSMAAGLLLMIGISIFFFQYLNKENKEMAMGADVKNENSVMENAPAKPNEASDVLNPAEQKEPQKTVPVTVTDKLSQAQAPSEERTEVRDVETSVNKAGEGVADDSEIGTTTGASAQSPVIADEKLKNQLQENQNANRRNNESPSGNVMGGAGGKDANKKSDLDSKEKIRQEIPATQKGPETNTKGAKDLAKERETDKDVATEEYKGDNIASSAKAEDISNEETKSRAKVSSRDVSKKRFGKKNKAAAMETTNPAKPIDAPGNFALSFSDSRYATAQQYVKSEIEKDEVLKSNVKDFSAKLLVDESGKVVKVNFITEFKTCSDCDERLGKILLNMPGWNSIPAQTKSQNRETIFTYPK